MNFLPDTNTCITFLRQRQARLISRWQGIDAHWSERPLEVNQLATGATW
jgi:hypothetical protein